jgi:hypothetical protein
VHADDDSVMAAPPAPLGAPPDGSAQPSPPRARTRPRRVVLGVVAGLVVAGGGGVFGVHAYAEHTVCSALQGDGGLAAASADGGSAQPSTDSAAELERAAANLRGSARLLLVDRSLRTAVDGIADDADRMAGVVRSAQDGTGGAPAFRQVLVIAGSLNSHARAAQTACGLPATGIFNG